MPTAQSCGHVTCGCTCQCLPYHPPLQRLAQVSLLDKDGHIPQICTSFRIPLLLYPGPGLGTLSCFPPPTLFAFPAGCRQQEGPAL